MILGFISLKDYLTIALRFVGAALAFTVTLVTTNLLPADDAGVYFVCFTVSFFVSTLITGGLEQGVTKEAGAFPEEISSAALRVLLAQIKQVLIKNLLTYCFCSLVFIVVAQQLSSESNFSFSFVQTFFIVAPLLSIMRIIAAFLNGLQAPKLGTFISTVLWPVLWLPLVIVSENVVVEDLARALVLALVVTNIFGAAILTWLLLTRVAKEVSRVARRRVEPIATINYLYISSIAGEVVNATPLIAVSLILTPTEAAQFAVAQRVTAILVIVQLAVTAIFSPQIAQKWVQEDLYGIWRLYSRATVLATSCVLPISLVILLAPELILELFGSFYVSATFPLLVCLLAQVINVITGPASATLAMTGYGRVLSKIGVASAGSGILLVPILSIAFGAHGAAVGFATVIVGMNIAALVCLKRQSDKQTHV